ncbi:MAG: excalibur calcium-binding domain-containing protein [Gammaproteobacteria bacterium]|nr:excalibur calcium-binding domain-containing protein [Gammaproteobacteria bacterium]MDH4256573.1 excalibur calcium-binding domain-containing protein [Gammaproteobacteria bacterium]
MTRQVWGAYQPRHGDQEFLDDSESSVTAQLLDQESASDQRSPYQCDGRVYCSQMTSCEEAKLFLANCPSVKMDGGGDGVACEKQWCGDRQGREGRQAVPLLEGWEASPEGYTQSVFGTLPPNRETAA